MKEDTKEGPPGEEEDIGAEIDAMIADLETESGAAAQWGIDELREIREELGALDRMREWNEQRVAEWKRRLNDQAGRALAVLALGGRLWRAGESAADLEREAERIRGGQAARHVPERTRMREAVLLEFAAKVLRDRTALIDEMVAVRKSVDSSVAESDEHSVARDHLLRSLARLIDDREILHRLNRERRRSAKRR